jgi:hypothetical protein
MELPGGLATIDPRHWRASLPCSSGSNAELTVFLIAGQAKVGGVSESGPGLNPQFDNPMELKSLRIKGFVGRNRNLVNEISAV